MGNLLDVLSRLPSPAIEARLAEQETALTHLRAEKVRLEREAAEIAVDANPAGDVLEVLAEAGTGGGGAVLRLNAALKKIVERVEIGTTDEARRWLEAGVQWADRHTGGKPFPSAGYGRLYAAVMADAALSIGVVFRLPGRHLVIFADPRRAGRFVGGAVRETGGAIEAFTLKVWSI